MSRLQELIQELCPNGVEYKKLGEVCDFRAGWGFPESEQGKMDGKYPFYKVADMNNSDVFMDVANNYISEEVSQKLRCKPAPKGTIIFPKIGAAMGTNKKRILTKDSCYDNNVMGLIAKSDIIVDRFLYYSFSRFKLMDFAKGTGVVPSLDTNKLKKLSIPVPPLAVQEEIVRILDHFTDLAAELQAELQARKEQYEYYRNELLSFDKDAEGVKWMKLREICFYPNKRIPASILQRHNYIGVDNLLLNKRGKKDSNCVPSEGTCIAYNMDDILIGNIRPYLKKIWYANNCGGASGDVLIFRLKEEHKENIACRYLYYTLSSDGFFNYHNRYAKGAKMPRGDKNMNMEYVIPIPPLAEQQRIVSILDKFETLVNNLTEGLPAEIAAVQEQYEYYRNRLLSFPRKEYETI